jgi:CBS domain-containing protein
VGVVRRASLDEAPEESPIAAVMDAPVAVEAAEPAIAAADIRDSLGDGPVPVVDDEGRLLGVIPA